MDILFKSWIKYAWGKVSEVTIVNCFKKSGFRKSQPDVQLTDFAEEKEFESLVKELSTDVFAAEYIDFENTSRGRNITPVD